MSIPTEKTTAVIMTAYGMLRSTQNRDGELVFRSDQLNADGVTTAARVTVEIGPSGPRPLFTPLGDDLARLSARATLLL